MRKLLKHMLSQGIHRSGLYRHYWRHNALSLMFHSISARPPGDWLTYTPESFDDICRFLKKYFFLTTYSELTKKITAGDDISRHLVISLDDGYKNNYTVAAPILEHHQLPACFFITTDFINSDHQPWWDKERGVTAEWMSWDDVRDLHQRGFEIGSHSCTHADFGQIDTQQAQQELLLSKQKMQQELDFTPQVFAYPYGQSQHMAPHNHELTKQHYPICITAIANKITHQVDIQYIPRIEINYCHPSGELLALHLLRRLRQYG